MLQTADVHKSSHVNVLVFYEDGWALNRTSSFEPLHWSSRRTAGYQRGVCSLNFRRVVPIAELFRTAAS